MCDSTYKAAYTHSEIHTNTQKYLHSSLVITQVKGTIADPEICVLIFLSNTPVKLEVTQQNVSSRAAVLSNAVLSVGMSRA